MRLVLRMFGREVLDPQWGAEPETVEAPEDPEDTQPDVVALPGYFMSGDRVSNRVGFVLPANDWED